MTLVVVTQDNLGADFDVGAQVADKLNVVAASSTVAGKVRLATMADAEELSAAVAISPSIFVALLTFVANSLPTTLPSTPGVLWNNNGTLQLS